MGIVADRSDGGHSNNVWTTDDYYDVLTAGFGDGMENNMADNILHDALDGNPELFDLIKANDYEGLIEYLDEEGYDVDEELREYYNQGDNMGEVDIDDFKEVYIPDEPYDADQSFYTGAEYKGSLQIVETENDKVYVPSSYYCHTKVFNKFLEFLRL